MSYIALEVAFFRNPKVLLVDRVARDIYIAALMYARENLTDGFVPFHVIPTLDPLTKKKAAIKAFNDLYLAELVTRKRGRSTGYLIPDYEAHQQTKAEVEHARLQARERKRKQREKEAASRAESRRDEKRDKNDVTPIEVEVEEKRSTNRAVEKGLSVQALDFKRRAS